MNPDATSRRQLPRGWGSTGSGGRAPDPRPAAWRPPRARGLALLLAVGLGAVGACGDEETADDGGGWTPPFDPGVCGMAAYQWLDPSTTGDLVSRELLPLYDYWPKEVIDTAIEAAGYQGADLSARYGASVYRFRYGTQDRGERVEATGVVAFPEDEELDESIEAPYVLWLHGTTGFMDDCAPSGDDRSDGALAALVMASQGYVTVAPDYIGMAGDGEPSTTFHPYLVAEATAIAAWDAMTAVEAIEAELEAEDELQAVTDDRVILWGASQGGHATLVTELYAPYYAPRWQVEAAVAMIPAVDLVAQAEVAMESWTGATALMAAMLVEHARWYGLEDRLDEVIRDDPPHHLASELPAALDAGCSIDTDGFELMVPEDLYQAELVAAATGDDWAGYEDWRCPLAENSLNLTSVARTSDTPILLTVGEEDGLLDPPTQRASFDALCDAGYQMEYIECLGADHVEGAFWSLMEQLDWVEARLAGEALANPCERGAPICCRGTDDGSCVP